MTKSKLNLLFPLLCLALCLIFPAVCSEGVRRGLALSLDAALPALFPSLVLSSLLTRMVVGEGKNCIFIPFFLGLLCGFPVGAAAVATLVREGRLSTKDGEKMLFFCNNAGPAFLISYCGQTVLSDTKKGVFLFLFQSTLSTLCFLFFFGKKLFLKEEKNEMIYSPFWKNIPDALREATSSFLYIMSCVIFFSFLTELIRHLFSLSGISYTFLGILTELCGGINLLRGKAIPFAFSLCALGCGWGGFSVHLQTAGILEGSGISLKNHFLGKIFFATVLFLLTLFFQKLLS